MVPVASPATTHMRTFVFRSLTVSQRSVAISRSSASTSLDVPWSISRARESCQSKPNSWPWYDAVRTRVPYDSPCSTPPSQLRSSQSITSPPSRAQTSGPGPIEIPPGRTRAHSGAGARQECVVRQWCRNGQSAARGARRASWRMEAMTAPSSPQLRPSPRHFHSACSARV